VIGKSIGTGPAIALAAQRKPGAVIFISGFSGIKAIISSFLPGADSWIDERFNNLKEISKVRSPCLLIHG